MAKPQIRLKGFDGEWENVCFKDFSYPAGEKNRDNLPLESYSISNEFGFVPQNEQFEKGGTMANADKRVYYIVKPDSFAYNPARINVGSIGYDNLDKDVIVSSLYVIFKTDSETNNEWLNIWFKTPYFKRLVELYQEGGVRLYFFYDKLCACQLNRPLLLEQKAIADYFKSLDSMLQSTTKKIESLKQMKSACLVSMFPQAGETTPRVRFQGFNGEWEKKLFCELYEPSSIKNEFYGTDKIISVANMYFKPVSYISDEDYLKSYNVMCLGDIAFEGNKSKNFAHGRFVENTIGDGIVSHVFVVLKPISKKYDLLFWKYLINDERIMGPILLRSTKHSTMMTDIVVADFLKESILVPSYEEQKKIGAFFESLDKQISLQEQRLEKLKKIKAACLDKLFV